MEGAGCSGRIPERQREGRRWLPVRSWRGLTDTVGTLRYARSAASKSGLRAEQDFLGQDGHLK